MGPVITWPDLNPRSRSQDTSWTRRALAGAGRRGGDADEGGAAGVAAPGVRHPEAERAVGGGVGEVGPGRRPPPVRARSLRAASASTPTTTGERMIVVDSGAGPALPSRLAGEQEGAVGGGPRQIVGGTVGEVGGWRCSRCRG
ncbi:hypothetical protein [Streptomyces sp. KL116D]|uniref:hypothetical protein n=1 Tax=Streptomyces sp. KL116D TaxID=3045152 RepID=UPI003556C14E